MMTLDQFKTKARKAFRADKTETVCKDPISFLYSLEWSIPNGPAFSEEVMAQMNVDFDENGCFGRALKAAVLCEQIFPTCVMYAGEVCEDLLRSMILQQACAEKWNDETFIAELLQYENPHIVILDSEGGQFDPIFTHLSDSPEKLKHPQVLKHTLWEGLYCSYLISQAMLYRNSDVDAYLQILQTAHSLSPSMILAKENLASAYCLIGQYDKSIGYAKEVVEKRKDAKTLFFLWKLTDDKVYKTKLIEQYDTKMLIFLNQNLPL
jgi:tetratricopeptide (TPR) repeat protein